MNKLTERELTRGSFLVNSIVYVVPHYPNLVMKFVNNILETNLSYDFNIAMLSLKSCIEEELKNIDKLDINNLKNITKKLLLDDKWQAQNIGWLLKNEIKIQREDQLLQKGHDIRHSYRVSHIEEDW